METESDTNESSETESDEMAGLKEISTGRKDIFVIPVKEISVREGWNARDIETPENQEHVVSLALSIKEMGVLNPILIEKDGDNIYVIDGHCRFAAVKYANENLGAEIVVIPCRVVDKHFSAEDRYVMQLVANSGKQLSAFEAGNNCKQLLAWGWSESDIARKIGKSVATVRNYVEAANLPASVRQEVNAGNVSVSDARALVREGGAEAVAAVVSGEVDKKLSDKIMMQIIFNFAEFHENSDDFTLVIEKEHMEWLKKRILVDKSSKKWDNFVDKYGKVDF